MDDVSRIPGLLWGHTQKPYLDMESEKLKQFMYLDNSNECSNIYLNYHESARKCVLLFGLA